MESIALDLIDHVPSIVTIVLGVSAVILSVFKLAGKKYFEERVSQGFRREMSRLELENQNIHSVTNEKRDAIYNYNAHLYQYCEALHNALYFKKYATEEGEWNFLADISKIRTDFRISKERLALFYYPQSFSDANKQLVIKMSEIQSLMQEYFSSEVHLSSMQKSAEQNNQNDGEEIILGRAHSLRLTTEEREKLFNELVPLLTNMRKLLSGVTQEVLSASSLTYKRAVS